MERRNFFAGLLAMPLVLKAVAGEKKDPEHCCQKCGKDTRTTAPDGKTKRYEKSQSGTYGEIAIAIKDPKVQECVSIGIGMQADQPDTHAVGNSRVNVKWGPKGIEIGPKEKRVCLCWDCAHKMITNG